MQVLFLKANSLYIPNNKMMPSLRADGHPGLSLRAPNALWITAQQVGLREKMSSRLTTMYSV